MHNEFEWIKHGVKHKDKRNCANRIVCQILVELQGKLRLLRRLQKVFQRLQTRKVGTQKKERKKKADGSQK